MNKNKTIFPYPFLAAAVFLLVGLVLQSCQNQQVIPTPTLAPLILPTVFPTERPTPVPTMTPIPTRSPTPLPKAVLQEPCISYYDQTNGDLKFTCYRSKNWRIETVDSAGDVGLYSSLAFDRFSRPYISYYSRSGQALKLAHYDENKWTIEIVDQGQDVGLFSSLAVRWDGTIFVSYYDKGSGYIKTAYKQNTQWIVDEVDNIGEHNPLIDSDAFKISLVLDNNGFPIVSYVDLEKNNLKFGQFDSNRGWSTETVDTSSNAGSSSSLILNSQGQPIITYYDRNLQALKMASLKSGEWNTEVLDSAGNVGAYSSAALTQTGSIVVAYFDDDTDNVRFKDDKGITYIRSKSRIGWYISMALDQTDNPWIIFYEHSQQDLGLAKLENGRFRITYIATNGEVGLYPSLRFIPKYETN